VHVYAEMLYQLSVKSCVSVAASLCPTDYRFKEWCWTEGRHSKLIWSHFLTYSTNRKPAVFGARFLSGDLHGMSVFFLLYLFLATFVN